MRALNGAWQFMKADVRGEGMLVLMDYRIRKAVELLRSGYSRELEFDILASELNISYSRFRHMFKAETGLSPAQYVKQLRMQHACHLLSTTYLSIKQVMAEVGLSDLSHFVRDFKRAFDMTPREYRLNFNNPIRPAPTGKASPRTVKLANK